ncbi:hypothetical protein M569_16654, partial [Genlisea aurea]
LAEGFGDCVWPDGCKYEGEWRCGTRHGTGKLVWPSGSTYEGEFSNGYIHGSGTFTRSDRLTYTGRWRLNLKHGLGHQRYPNGDVFDGSWIRGTPEGPAGKYRWRNGNVYVGDMRGGKMSGKGTLTWVNGDTYEGSWMNGLMHGFGVYTWADGGGSYVGTWTKGLKDGKGALYPRGSRQPYVYAPRKQNQAVSHIQQHATSKQVAEGIIKSRTSNVSLERRWSLEVSIEKLLLGYDRSSNASLLDGEDQGNPAPILEREYMQGVLISEMVLSSSFSPSYKKAMRRQTKSMLEAKRPGEQIIKGHRSYDLMLSLQLGIRYTVGRITPIQRREVRISDFGPRACFWMSFPKDGSQMTPPHQSEDFKWKDYCPLVFR